MNFKRLTCIMAMSLLGALGLPRQGSAQGLTITTFDAPGAGTGPGQGTVAGAISPTAVIAGLYFDANNVKHGFVRSPGGSITTFDAPGAGTNPGQGTIVESINLGGAISGEYLDANNVYHGFLRAPNGTFTTFDAPGAGTGPFQGSFGRNINLGGAIAGFYIDTNNVLHGFLRAPDGTFTPFDAPGAGTGPNQGTRTAATDGLTDAGAITGTYIDSNFVNHAYVRAPDGTFTPFDAPGAGTGAGQGTASGGINLAGATTGESKDANRVFHGFLRTPDGTIATFNAPGAGTGAGQGTVGENLNALNAITGQYMDSNNVNHGFVRAPDGTITTFDVSGAGASAGQGTFPVSNNDAGAITGLYTDASGVTHGFIAVPRLGFSLSAFVSTVYGDQILTVDAKSGAATVLYPNNTSGQLSPPVRGESMTVGPDNLIYICEASFSHRIIRMDQTGNNVQVVYNLATATAPNNPSWPDGPSFDNVGNLFFNDIFTGALWMFPAAQLTSLPAAGAVPVNVLTAAQTGATGADGSAGTAFDSHGNLLIVSPTTTRVLLWNGTSVSTFIQNGGNGCNQCLSVLTGIAVNSAGDVFVGSNPGIGFPLGGVINRFSSTGAFQNQYVSFADTSDGPLYFAFDSADRLFVVTSGNVDFRLGGKLWRIDPPTTPGLPGTKTLLVDLYQVSSLTE